MTGSVAGPLSPLVYRTNPQSLLHKVQNGAESYFDLGTGSWLVTMAKVISYVTVVIPALALVLRTVLRWVAPLSVAVVTSSLRSTAPPMTPIQAVIKQTPEFHGYVVGQGTPYEGTRLSNVSVRPANLFYDALLREGQTTLPGSGELFSIKDHEGVHSRIMVADPDINIEISARGKQGRIFGGPEIADLGELYGNATYRLSVEEIQNILESQKIYVSSLMPLPFYQALKQAMLQDRMVVLPGHDRAPVKVSDLQTRHCRQLIANVRRQPEVYGFSSSQACENLLNLTVYELGSLVIKIEDYYLFLDGKGKIRERQPGDKGRITLLNACGIRGIARTTETTLSHRTILQETFTGSFRAAAERAAAHRLIPNLITPAVGLGVWQGDPNLYWRAFLDALVQEGTPFRHIYVNPRHRPTPRGIYQNRDGSEFQLILDEYLAHFANEPQALANLQKIINLYDSKTNPYGSKTDLLQLAHNLTVAFSTDDFAILNASDPDVTLCNHVTEYSNNTNHPDTTEEHYSMMGTNGICFETITKVHKKTGNNQPNRIVTFAARSRA